LTRNELRSDWTDTKSVHRYKQITNNKTEVKLTAFNFTTSFTDAGLQQNMQATVCKTTMQ